MSAPSAPPASAPIRVPAGTTAGARVREGGLSTSGPEAIVVVRDAEGALRDLAWAPEADAEVVPVPANRLCRWRADTKCAAAIPAGARSGSPRCAST